MIFSHCLSLTLFFNLSLGWLCGKKLVGLIFCEHFKTEFNVVVARTGSLLFPIVSQFCFKFIIGLR